MKSYQFLKTLGVLSLFSVAGSLMGQTSANLSGTYTMVQISSLSENYGGQVSSSYLTDTVTNVTISQNGSTFVISKNVLTQTSLAGTIVNNSITALSGPCYLNPYITFSSNSISSFTSSLTTTQLVIRYTGMASVTSGGISRKDSVSTAIFLTGTFNLLQPPTIATQPKSQTIVFGSNAVFKVAARGATPLHYQWLQSGQAIPDATNSSYAITSVEESDADSYSVQVVNALGGTNSSAATLSLVYPPTITAQPSSIFKQQLGTKGTLTVAASGTAPLRYQWALNGTPVSNATNASYTVDFEPIADQTNFTYSVTVANAYGTILSSNSSVTIVPDTVLPLVSITSPTNNARSNKFVFKGGATDNGHVVEVKYWITNLNNGGSSNFSGTATLTGANLSKLTWQASPPPLFPGTNVLTVQSRDQQGNLSLLVSTNFFYQVPATFVLTMTGAAPGSLTGKTSVTNAGEAVPKLGTNNLYIGQGYTVQAIPGAKPSGFDCWTGNGFDLTTNSTIKFIMETGLTLQASFKILHYPPTITNQPISVLKQLLGTQNKISVAASGTAPLYYQWALNGQPIANATNTSCPVSFEPVDGLTNLTYGVTITNLYGTITSSNSLIIVQPDTTLPLVTITSPAANARTNKVVFKGTASDNGRLMEVRYWITNINAGVISNVTGSATLIGTNLSKLTWQAAPTLLLPGTNILAVQCRDEQGNLSAVAKTNFFYQVPAAFILTSTGTGIGSLTGKSSITNLGEPIPKLGTNYLYIGQGYSVQAVAGVKPSYFATWTSNGVELTTNATIRFIMKPELTLQASFMTLHYPPTVTSQPTNSLKQQLGTKTTISVAATGTAPLFYQWAVNGVAIEKATNTTCAVNFEPVNGRTNLTYTVTITNLYGSIVSSNSAMIVQPDTLLPLVTIISPSGNPRTNNVIFTGAASDNGRLVEVRYWITNFNNGVISNVTGTASLIGSNLAKLTWQASPTLLLPGSNTLAVQSRDLQGNLSLVAKTNFFYRVPAALIVTAAGTGAGSLTGKSSITNSGEPFPKLGTNNLYIGQAYSIQAVPTPKTSFFSNWTGNGFTTTTNTTIKFIMEPGLTLQANFITNFFIGLAGTYNGLFYNPDQINVQSAGMLSQLLLNADGTYSGKLSVNGATYPLSGGFNLSSHSRATVTRSALAGGALVVNMDLTTNQITGTVAATNWTSELLANVSANPIPSTNYTALIEPDDNNLGASADGYGFLLISNKAGVVTFTGTLADSCLIGSPIAQTVPLSKQALAPIYVSLYKTNQAGLLLGWLDLTSSTNTLCWIRPASTNLLYPKGFTNIATVLSSTWTAPKGAAMPFSTNSPGFLQISGGNLTNTLIFSNIVVGTDNKIINAAKIPTNGLSGTIAPQTGLVTLNFTNVGVKITATGAILQNLTTAGGAFLGRTNTGSFILSY